MPYGGQRLVEDLLPIVAGAEDLPFGLEDDDLHGAAFPSVLQTTDDFLLGFHPQGISLLGTVQSEHPDLFFLLIKNILVIHPTSSSPPAFGRHCVMLMAHG